MIYSMSPWFIAWPRRFIATHDIPACDLFHTTSKCRAGCTCANEYVMMSLKWCSLFGSPSPSRAAEGTNFYLAASTWPDAVCVLPHEQLVDSVWKSQMSRMKVVISTNVLLKWWINLNVCIQGIPLILMVLVRKLYTISIDVCTCISALCSLTLLVSASFQLNPSQTFMWKSTSDCKATSADACAEQPLNSSRN